MCVCVNEYEGEGCACECERVCGCVSVYYGDGYCMVGDRGIERRKEGQVGAGRGR